MKSSILRRKGAELRDRVTRIQTACEGDRKAFQPWIKPLLDAAYHLSEAARILDIIEEMDK